VAGADAAAQDKIKR